MKHLARLLLLPALALTIAAAPSRAQNSRLIYTPHILQEGFGLDGSGLPNDGGMYCGPTATNQAMWWFGANGFTNIAPSTFTDAEAQNLDRVLAGIMQTSPGGGTTDVGGPRAMPIFFSLKGLPQGRVIVYDKPTYQQIAGNALSGYNMMLLTIGWYNVGTTTRNGGHFVTVVYVDPQVSADPNATAGTIFIANPMSTTTQNVPAAVLTSGGKAGFLAFPQGSICGPTIIPVIETAIVYNLGAPTSAIAPYNLTAPVTIGTNDGFLDAVAPLTGSGALTKNGEGALHFQASAANDFYTGQVTVDNGTLSGAQEIANPFGTGPIVANAGAIVVRPGGAKPSIEQSVAGGAGQTYTYLGSVLGLFRGAHDTATLTIGGNDDTVTENLVREPGGNLTLLPYSGVGGLGVNEFIKVRGSIGNIPQTYPANGMADASTVIADANTGFSGDFATYNGTDGFLVSAYTDATDASSLRTADSSDIFNAAVDQTLLAGDLASVYALKVPGTTISGPVNSTLTIGAPDAVNGAAGVILNGGATISVGQLQFGSNDAVFFVDNAGATVTSLIHSNTRLVMTGNGRLRLTNPGTFLTPIVASYGTLFVDLPGGILFTSVPVSIGATGTIEGQGSGLGAFAVTGKLIIGDHTKGKGTLSIGMATFSSQSTLVWSLGSLTDESSGGGAGTDWAYLTVGGDLALPDPKINAYTNLLLDFTALGAKNPNSGDPFWNQPHTWTIASAGRILNVTALQIDDSKFPRGKFTVAQSGNDLVLSYALLANPPDYLQKALQSYDYAVYYANLGQNEWVYYYLGEYLYNGYLYQGQTGKAEYGRFLNDAYFSYIYYMKAGQPANAYIYYNYYYQLAQPYAGS